MEIFSALGTLLIWLFKGGEGKSLGYRNNTKSFIVGFSFILVIVIMLGGSIFI